jgi:translocator protein
MTMGSDDQLTKARRASVDVRAASGEDEVWERQRQRNHPEAAEPPAPYGISPADLMMVVVWTVVCLGAGVIGSIGVSPDARAWTTGLAQPFFALPAALYAPAWTVAYLVMAGAAWAVNRAPVDNRAKADALTLFSAHLALNMSWSLAFYGARDPWLGVLVAVLMLDCLVAATRRFWALDWRAGAALVPIVGWTGFHVVLALTVALMN